MNTSRNARRLEAADRDARSKTNREIDEAFAAWEASEAALAQAHISAARDLRQMFEDILK